MGNSGCRSFLVSIHTLHELEASVDRAVLLGDPQGVSIHTLHELEASFSPALRRWLRKVSIHTLHELEASGQRTGLSTAEIEGVVFPFIRFTNWKQGEINPGDVIDFGAFPFIRFTNWKQVLCHASSRQ